jgi:sugar phosphate isomerase/epimerase
MKIGYGTYGVPELQPAEALPRLASMGYETVEVCVAPRYPTSPSKLDARARQALKEQIAASRLELSGLMIFVNLLAASESELDEQQEQYRAACVLARDLAANDTPLPVLSTIGHGDLTWERDGDTIVDRVAAFARLAASEGCRFALEPHVGGLLCEPERTRWVVDAARTRPGVPERALGINFDISHFSVAGYPLVDTIRLLAPITLHTHVKDGRMQDGKVRFLLPGEGGTDYVTYFREMAAAGWTGPITVEITAQIFNLPDYAPWPAAEFSLKTLREARAQA